MIVSQELITSDIQQEFGGTEHEKEKVILANQAMALGMEWMHNQVKSEDPNMSKGDKRRARRAQKAALRAHIEQGLKQSDNPQAVGFIIASFILMLIFESVVSWVVWRILDHYFA